ncbi:hypothetical protein PTSG_06293 [Salpingoeca rosetta]|uniref:Mitochondrial cardiolipin hydrolase n=1 Tax=Salpingoeca rosetta (strain ATCC 50818 / BSB-021) TaxID=946362 RepID=F2UCH7_SALR5|nr:uncharacterized protein PTSG_06293 [Salpingoeca rosetta]EGD74284.1 hypothetical protein PTSG_06293 [Salpingoeca rosetta]|eukprot:XP_004993184.1 hypothetical protein PTSG_06293 [Salpingoeca rosetta]
MLVVGGKKVAVVLAVIVAAAAAAVTVMAAAAADPSCCKYCSDGSKACGDSCISDSNTCHQPPGCACNGTAPPSPPSDPSYDHQTKTYHAQFKPLELSSADLTITPFFSPDHSVDTIVDFISKASKTLDIITPSFSSWSHCSSGSPCVGCKVSTCSGEKFPVFQAILNAAHRGVSIRIITNDFGDVTCEGKIAPFDFLSLNGVKVGMYTSTTFTHSKFMMRDSNAASISSVNWSRSSYMKNREAGANIEGKDMALVIDFLTAVYERDWEATRPYNVTNSYSASDMAIITNPAHRDFDIPSGPDRPYVSPKPKPIPINAPFKLWTSPDFSYKALMSDLQAVKHSFKLYIYQVTDDRLCDWLLDAHKRGVNITMLVSSEIYGSGDQQKASECFEKLQAKGLVIHRAWQFGFYMYNHQKFWIADGTRVSFSTGNWSPSDFPGGDGAYPPYGEPGWQSVNRDFNVRIDDPAVAKVFDDVIMGDWSNSTTWHPPHHHAGAVSMTNLFDTIEQLP